MGAGKNGICPLMSQGVIAQGNIPNQNIMPAGTPQMAVMAATVPCVGKECQLWDNVNDMCSLKSQPTVIDCLGKLEPPSAESPLSRIAELFEQFVNRRKG